MLVRVLELLLPVRRGERRLTFTLFFHSLFAVGAFLAGRTVRDALFLENLGRESLAWMYVASAVAVTLAGLVYGRLAVRMRRDTMALASASLFAGLFFVLFALERTKAMWVYSALYVFVEVMGAMVLVQFWTLANEIFNSREAKRLYGFIGAGGTFANIFIGLLAARVATTFGTNSLMLLCGVLLVATAVVSNMAGRAGRQRLVAKAATGRSTVKRAGGMSRVLGDGHLRTVALLSAVTFFTTTLVDYEFKVVAADLIKGDALAAYFGYFSATVGVLALGLQLFGTSRLLNRVGVIGSLAVLPLSLGLGNAALVLFPALWAASMAKGADTLFRYSVNDATTQILYLPVPSQARVSAKAFIDGVVKPVSIGLAGLTLAAYKTFFGGNPYHVAFVALALCGVWLGVVAAQRSKYIKTLHENLKQRRLDLESARHSVNDSSTNSVLDHALSSQDEREVLNALEMLPHLEKLSLDQKVESLLEHASAEVRTKALEYYAHRQTMRFANSVFRRFEDKDPSVRAAAIDAFSAIGRDKAVRSVRPYLDDADPRIRSAAVIGMIKYGGLDGVLVAAEALKRLIDHPDGEMRRHAAHVLGAIGVRNFYQPVLKLMSDEDPRVRREAIIAAGQLRSPEFVIPLIYRTQTIETMREAISALSAYGQVVLPTLTKVMENQLEDAQIRRSVARVLGRLGTPDAVRVIASHLDEPDEELRGRLYRALARAVKGRRVQLEDTAPVRAAITREFARAYRALHVAEAMALPSGPTSDTPARGDAAALALLGSALEEKVTETERRIFVLLAVLYPDADMEQIDAGIRDATSSDAARRRANAVELLDNLLDRDLKRQVLPLVEDHPRAERLAMVAELQPRPEGDRAQLLLTLCRDESSWVRACAVWALDQSQEAPEDTVNVLETAVADQSAIVREIALVSLELRAPLRAAEHAEARLRDDAPVVRRQAALITSRAAERG